MLLAPKAPSASLRWIRSCSTFEIRRSIAKRRSFEEEFILLSKKAGIEFDPAIIFE